MPSDRRAFLKHMAAAPAAMAAASQISAAPASEAAPLLPQIKLGKHSVSRLICGSNCFNAGSHLSVFVNYEMRAYYTPEQILKTVRRCEEVGVNCWQAGHGNLELYRRYLDTGGKMHLLAIESSQKVLEPLAKGGCIGVAHHGEVSDNLFRNGKLDQIHDFSKQVHDAGMLAGVSTHIPDVVDAIESKGWEVDYYMTCVYQRHRNRDELKQLLGHVPLPVGEVYLESDPPRVYKVIQQTKRPCLAFKILAAGRLSERKPWIEQAFKDTLAAIKPTDGVIVGLYDRYSDQAAENAALVKQYTAAAKVG